MIEYTPAQSTLVVMKVINKSSTIHKLRSVYSALPVERRLKTENGVTASE
jgi:hypothetical protein